LWDVSSKNVLQKMEGHEGAAIGVDTHPTEKFIVSGGLDKTIRVWKYEEPESRTGLSPAMQETEIQEGMDTPAEAATPMDEGI